MTMSSKELKSKMMQRGKMMKDDRCRRSIDDRSLRVMKNFRKRRRQKSGLTATRPENPRPRRRRTLRTATDGDEYDDDDDFVEEESPSSFYRSREYFARSCRYFVEQNSGYHRYHNHQNQNYKRRNLINWGENIARRRAFSRNSKKNEDRDGKKSTSSDPELVYRKPENFSYSSFYSSCTFLDSYDRVLAVDNRGTLDLIRLADIRSQPNSYMGQGKKTPSSHQKFVTDFELGAELKQQSFSTVRVQALSGGRTVAFGLEDDSLCLLQLEEKTNRYICSGTNRDGILTPVLFSTGSPSSSLLPLLTASRTNHPRRTHYRDRQNPGLSLKELCRHRINNYGEDSLNKSHSNNYTNARDNPDVSELLAVDYTSARGRISSPVRFIPGLRPPHDARWDVLEINSSCSPSNSLLYVAHVDSDYDAFWTQVLDGRVRASTTATTAKANRNSYNATTILVDGTTRDRPGRVEEHVTACAMVTDVCMATAHISCGNYGSTPASEFFDRGLPYAGYSGMSSCVKLWDLRMVRKKNKAIDDSPVPADTIVFPAPPSFQNADFAVVEPSVTIMTEITSTEGKLAFAEAAFADESYTDIVAEKTSLLPLSSSSSACSDHVITNLSSVRDPYDGPNNNGSARGGSIIVTTQSRTKSSRVEHAKLDLSGTMRMTRRISQMNSSLGCQPVYAIASSHKYLATCSNERNSSATCNSEGLPKASTKLSLYNLNLIEAPSLIESTSKKTRYSLPSSRLNQQQREDPSWSYQMDASLIDRYGARTELSCIALNSNGTALLGGTTDGDLFVWRGI